MASYNTSQFKKGTEGPARRRPLLDDRMQLRQARQGPGAVQVQAAKPDPRHDAWIAPTRAATRSRRPTSRKSDAQYLYRQGDQFVFMDNENYEQYELTKEQVDEAWKYLKEGMICAWCCSTTNRSPSPPQHVVLKVEYASRPSAATRPPTSPSRPRWKPAPNSPAPPSSKPAT